MNHHPPPDTQFFSTFDLRVVAGLHAGARIAIGESANDVLSVGHDPKCDVVLQDPALAEGPLTIRLARTAEGIVRGWQADSLKMPRDAVDAAHVLALGEVVSWRGLSLTVAEQDAPWPSIDILHEARIAGDAALASEAILTRDATDTAHQGSTSGDDPPRDPSDKRQADVDGEDGVPALTAEVSSPLDTTADDNANAVAPDEAMDLTNGLPSDHNADSTHPDKPKGLASRLRACWSLIPAAVVVAMVSVIVVFLLGMLLIRILNGAGANTSPAKVISATANQSAPQVTKVIERLGLSSVLHLQTTPDGVVAVVGWVKDEAQRDQVASALAQVTPMPGMMVGIESEAVDTAQRIVKQYGAYIDVINQGGGKIGVIGLIEPAAARAQLETAFRSQLPTAVLLDDRLLDRNEMAAMLESRLTDAGMAELGVVWTDAGMLIDARGHGRHARPDTGSASASVASPSDQHRARFQARNGQKNAQQNGRQDVRQNARIDGDKVYGVVQAFKQQYGMRLPIFAHFNGAQEALAPRALPFNISSITGGPLPSVVVGDGSSASGRQTRLLPGAIYRGYKLLSVTPQQVIFDGPQRVVVTR
jgi:type III secretion protein D